MDWVAFESTFSCVSCSPTIPSAKPLLHATARCSFLKFSDFRKLRSSPTSASFRPPSNARSSLTNQNNNFLGLVKILRNIKNSIFSRTQRWASGVPDCGDSQEVLDSHSDNYLQNGGIGVALLSVTSNAQVKISPFVATLASNPTFVSGLFAWFVAQSIKVILNFFVEKKWDLRIFFASGGMPSSHSALCIALTTSVALCHGISDSLFPVCLGFSSIVMYDAIGVRRHAGMQAEVLNMIVEDLFQGHPISQRKLKELLGHTPSQVFAGALLGILVACICCGGGCLVTT
ncbi:uncharacterized protein LOC104443360 [Eucalyptus grandis]|uniref:uncharacterized protein LOC104443360 n=1 Tax=Eucalyptus grandis TaxID=71139 RepID=UPI00192EA4FD|nr:uncharacterized protein LOC104443360 [Eucalyptus grandis]